MKHRKFIGTLAVFVLLGTLISACQPTTQPTIAPTTPPPAAPTLAPAQPEPTTPVSVNPTAAPTTASEAFVPMKLAAPDCSYGGEMKSVEAIDEHIIRFTLCNPDAAFLPKITGAAFFILHKNDLDSTNGDTTKMDEHPNGTGPWILKEWVKGDHLIYQANPNYWRGKPKSDTFIVRWSEQPSQRLLELQSGTVDGIDNVSPDDFATIQADPNIKLYPVMTINTFWLGFSNAVKPFDDIKVRQAISMAIDRKRIVDTYYPMGSNVAEGMLPPSIKPGPSENIPWYNYDVEAAKKLLAEAGYPNGLDIELSYRPVVRVYLPLPDKIGQEIQSQLAKIGVRVKLNQMESTTFLDSWYAGKLGMVMIGGSIAPDATQLINWMFNDSQKAMGNSYPEINKEALIASQLGDPAERQAHYDKINQLIKDNVPLIPIAHGASAVAWKASALGVLPGPMGTDFSLINTGNGQIIWDQNAEPGAVVCNDINDAETYTICQQSFDLLVDFKPGTAEFQPALAESWSANADATEWTFKLRQDVTFQDGQPFTANDVAATFIAQWDASSPNHTGRTGTFDVFTTSFGNFLNAKK